MIRPVLGVSLMGVMALGSATLITNEHASLIASDPHASLWSAQTVLHQTCEGAPLAAGEEVRGLYGAEIPAMASAERTTFNGAGQTVIYSMRATPEAVASFYSERLAGNCWKQMADGSLTFIKGAHAVRIELAEDALIGKTYVAYAQGVVAGVSTENIVWAAQDGMMPPPPPPGDAGSFSGGTPPPPPPGGFNGMPPPQGDFGGQQGGFPPPPQGNFTNQQGFPPQPPSGQGFPPSGFVPSNTNAPGQFPGGQGQFPGGPQNGPQGAGSFGGGQTCRVNGVEMPGPCSQYEGKSGGGAGFGPGSQGQFGGPQGQQFGGQGFDQGGMGFGPGGPQGFGEDQQGPSEQQMDEQRFKMMKAGAKQFMAQVKMMKKRMEQLKKKMKGCALPAEIGNALSASDGLMAKIESAQSATELESVLTDVEDVTSTLQESGQDIPEYMRACEMRKRIGKDVASLEKKAKPILAKGKKDLALAELVQALEGDIAAVKALVKEGEALAGTDVSEAGAKFEEAYDKFQDIGDGMEALDISLNLQKNLARLTKKVKSYEAAIARKEKKKEDMSEERASLEEFKSSLSELQAAIKNKGGKDTLIDLMQSLYETKQALDELLGGPVDGQSMVPKINVQEKGFDFQAPEGFERQMMPQGMGGFGPGGGPGGFGPSGDQGFGGSGGGFGQGIPQGGSFGAPGGGLQGQGQPTTPIN